MQVTSCRRRPALRSAIPGSSPSNCEPRSTQQPPTRAVVESGGEGRPRVRQDGREDAQSQTQRDGGVAEMERAGRVEGGGR